MEAYKIILIFASLFALGSTFPQTFSREEGVTCAKLPDFMKNSDRIVGGEFAPSNIPWQAQVFVNSLHECGATIIDAKTILSAAHCFYPSKEDIEKENIPKESQGKNYIKSMDVTIRVGFTDSENPGNMIQVGHIEKAIWPSDIGKPYKYPDNDIVILKLKSPLKFNSKVLPACLPSPDWAPENDEKMKERCFVSGWGNQAYEGQEDNYPDKVKWVRVPVMTNEKCAQTDAGGVSEQMICAGYPGKGVKDACQGDSGGPLVCQGKNGAAILTGVVSFGDDCGSATHPGVYARVTQFVKWIKDNMEKSAPGPAPTPAPGKCKFPEWKGDGVCDPQNNNAGCEFDGGDCKE